MAAALGGLDALVVTGGVGENAPEVRRRACAGLEFLGVGLDEALNGSNDGDDREIGSDGAAVRSLVVAARKDLEIARQVRELFQSDAWMLPGDIYESLWSGSDPIQVPREGQLSGIASEQEGGPAAEAQPARVHERRERGCHLVRLVIQQPRGDQHARALPHCRFKR
jgi:Acetokinase family